MVMHACDAVLGVYFTKITFFNMYKKNKYNTKTVHTFIHLFNLFQCGDVVPGTLPSWPAIPCDSSLYHILVSL